MRVIIAAAGTAGHINPGLAIANKIKKEEPNSEILFIGTNRGLENDLVQRAGYKLEHVEAYGLGKNMKNNLKTFKGIFQAKKIIRNFNPDIVIGAGGYICGPAIIAAHMEKKPTMLHESNAYPGKAVKMFSKKVDTVLVGFEDAKSKLEGCKNVVVTGTPTKIRKIEVTAKRRNEILEELGIKNDLPIVLIFGGSQGAQRINEAVVELIKQKKNDKYQIIWATGTKQFDIVKENFERENIYINNIKNVKVLPYIYNMEELMNISDLMVCRSGAMTITEVSIVGKPAIFIPLPSISANRQEDNALVLKKIGAAKMILNNEVNGTNLSEEINEIIHDKIELEEMGKMAETIAPSNVEEKIYVEIEKILKK